MQRWDLIIDIRSSNLSYLLNCKKRMIFKSKSDAGHMIQQFSSFLHTADAIQPKIWFDQMDEKETYEILPHAGPMIAIAPFSNCFRKDWPIEQYIKLLQHPIFKPYIIVLTGITKDVHAKGAIDKFIAQVPLPVINLFDWGHLRHMVPIFERCDIFIGSDSGLMHLAASTRCKTIGLFGPTDANRYGPWNNTVVQSSNYSQDFPHVDLSVEQVLQSVQDILQFA